MADKRISELQALARSFNPSDLLIIRGFLENKDFKITYAQLAAAIGTGDVLDADTLAALAGNGGTPSASNLFVTVTGLNAILASLDLEAGAREISTTLVITSDTAGTVTSNWVDHEGDNNTVTAQALTFSGAPSAGNFRYDWVVGNDDGTASVVTGTPNTEGAVVPPSISGTQLGLRLILWNEDGEGQVSPPVQDTGDFSNTRMATAIAANTTGKYAKVWEGQLSGVDNYAIELSYQEPRAVSAPYPGSGMRNLKVSFTCDGANIDTNTVQIETDGGEAGEWVLYQIAGNKAALYHKSNQYWGRIQYRVLFQNSAVSLADFVNGGVYGSAPGSPVGTWPSWISGGVSLLESNTVPFNRDYIIGNAGARSGNILFDFTGAKLGATTEMLHDNDGAYTFPSEAELRDFETTRLAAVTGDVKFGFTLVDKTASSEVVDVRLSLTEAQLAEYNA